MGESLPHTMERYREQDVHNMLDFDAGIVAIPLRWTEYPEFEQTVLEEDETTQVLVNSGGGKTRVFKEGGSLPQYLSFVVRDRASWEQVKEERFGPDIEGRFPRRWDTLVPTFHDMDYPLGLSVMGFFGMPRNLMGVESQLMMYYDDPALMHDINDHMATLYLTMLEEVVSRVTLDYVYIWEDMAYKNGPLMSPRLFAEFNVPYYRRLTDFLRAHGVNIICVDTDGDCRLLIPGFLEGGIAGLYPFEAMAGMDVVEIRKQYPQLLIQGGIDKTKIARGKGAIDAELEAKLPFMLSQGGYVPHVDHLVPPGVSWEDFCYYRRRVREYVGRYQPE
jgi:uroporphyrinogen decarboxylase